MVRSQGPAAEVRAGRDGYARSIREVDALDRPLPPTRGPLFPLVADEPGQRGRLGEGGPGTKDRQGADEERPLTGHRRDRVRVELESVFEGIDSGVDPDPGADEEPGMRGDLRPATVREFDDRAYVVRRPGRLFFLRPVEVELEEVRSVVELRRRGLQEGGPVIRLDQEATCDHAAVADPRSGDPNPRSIRVQSPPFPHAEGEGPLLSVPRIHGERRPDVAGPAHAGAAQEVPIVLRDLEQFLRRIGTAVDPVRAAGKRDVAVGIDHAWNDRGATGVDDVDVRWKGALIATRTNPDHVARVDEDAHLLPQRWSARVGKGCVPIQSRSRNDHRSTRCVVRLNFDVQRLSRRTRRAAGPAGTPPPSPGTPRNRGPGRAPPVPRGAPRQCEGGKPGGLFAAPPPPPPGRDPPPGTDPRP